MPTVPFSLRIDTDLKSALEREAQLQSRSVAYIAQEAIGAFLEAREARRRMLQQAAEELDKGEFVSEEAVTAWVESWGTDKELPMPEPDIFLKKQTA
jgi:predicted transcriptional regulator